MKGGYNIDPLDLMQLGTVVYIHKLKTWDESKKAKMITYYYRDMKTKMQRFVMAHAFPIRQGSVFIQHLAYNISKVTHKYLQDTEEPPTDEQLAEELNIRLETIKYCKRITSMTTTSLEEMPTLLKIAAIEKEEGEETFDPITNLVHKLVERINGTEEIFIELLTCLEDKKNLSEDLLTKLKEEI
jgi:DNA-directed RNA polymerase specialized sigma subunit|tara:strand:+ start:1058 stop:1612 length:555 start_codon:yes stop_codon:yes gene_type:complete